MLELTNRRNPSKQKIDSPAQLKAARSRASKLPSLIPHCTNEEQTKITLINPYLEYLGRDVRDPNVVVRNTKPISRPRTPRRSITPS